MLILPERSLCIPEMPIFGCPDEHISLSCGEECLSVTVSVLGGSRVEFGIVIDFEVYPCICNGLPLPVDNTEIYLSCTSIVVYQIDFSEVVCAQHHFFGAFVVAESTCVHEHGA